MAEQETQVAPVGAEEAESATGEEAAGTFLVEWTDGLLVEETGAPPPPLLEQVLSWTGLGEELPAGGLPPAALFDGLLDPSCGALPPGLQESFEVVAAPGAPLAVPLQPGDVLLRRPWGERHLTHVALLVDGCVLALEQVLEAGLIPEHFRPGFYAQVVEGGARPHGRAHGFARLVADAAGRVPGDQMLLRPRYPAAPPDFEETSVDPQQVENTLRLLAVLALYAQIPCDFPYSDVRDYPERCHPEKFQRITDAKWRPDWGPGTTCGFLTSWLLYALGCRDGSTVNRDDPAWNATHRKEESLAFKIGKNICMLREDPVPPEHPKEPAKLKAAWVAWDTRTPERRPKVGDIVHITRDVPPGKQDPSHVFVFLEEFEEGGKTYWLTADGGQTSPSKSSDKNISSFMCFNLREVTFPSGKPPSIGNRHVTGWLDLMRLPAQKWTWAGGLPLLDERLLETMPAPWPLKQLGDKTRFAAQGRARKLARFAMWGLLCNWPYAPDDAAGERMRDWVTRLWQAEATAG